MRGFGRGKQIAPKDVFVEKAAGDGKHAAFVATRAVFALDVIQVVDCVFLDQAA